MPGELITTRVSDGIATLTLNNPPLNVVSIELTRQLNRTLDALATDPEVRVLILTGAGDRAFCAGSNIKEFPLFPGPGELVAGKVVYENETFSKLDDFPKPTIAALNGVAFGGGLELAVCCDLLVAEEHVCVALPEAKLGGIPGSGGTVRITRRVGEGRVKELAFIGDPIDAQTALSWGLLNRVVPSGQALTAAVEMATAIAARPNRALQLIKKCIDMAYDMPEDEAISRSFPLSDEVFQTHDFREGVGAFLGKRSPRFQHR